MSDVTSALLKHLRGLKEALDTEFLAGGIHYEADVQCAAACFLQQQLRSAAGHWIVGCEHVLPDKRRKPDIICYHIPSLGMMGEMIEDRAAFAVGVIEVKYASGLNDDLEKLARMQEHMGGIKRPVAWMILGDHFHEEVHATNYRNQLRREGRIERWVAEDPEHRGRTILKVGAFTDGDSASDRAVREAFNVHHWD